MRRLQFMGNYAYYYYRIVKICKKKIQVATEDVYISIRRVNCIKFFFSQMLNDNVSIILKYILLCYIFKINGTHYIYECIK